MDDGSWGRGDSCCCWRDQLLLMREPIVAAGGFIVSAGGRNLESIIGRNNFFLLGGRSIQFTFIHYMGWCWVVGTGDAQR